MFKHKFFVFIALSLFSFGFMASTAYAQTLSSGAITTSATIASEFTFKITVENQNPVATTTTMNFGELVRANDSELQAATFYKVYAELNTLGAPSHLTQTASALTRSGGSETIPNGSFVMKTTYEPADNAGQAQPTGVTMLPVQTAVGTKEIYADPTGSHRVVTILYYLTGDPTLGATEKISFDQKSGSYSGIVEYTLVSD